MKTMVAILFVIIGVSTAVAGPRAYACFRAATQIAVDGVIDEPAWEQAEWTDAFVDIEGGAKPSPRFRTQVKMLWDDSCFYVAAQLEEPQLWATISKRDSIIFYDNDFEIFLDPDGDNWEYGEFEINALNTVWDLFLPKPYKDNGHPDDAWTIIGLRTAVSLGGTLNAPGDVDQGWSVEVAMPWRGLARCSHQEHAPADGDQWRVNFSRVEWKLDVVGGKYVKVPKTPEDNWVWSPQGVINMHCPETWGIVQFTRSQELKPIAIVDRYQRERDALHHLYYAEVDFFRAHQRWCGSVDSLALDAATKTPRAGAPMITLTADGYSAQLHAEDAATAVITQDSHFRIMPR
jgi:hypothetical protein